MRTRTIAQLHAALPKTIDMGVAMVKRPQKLHMIEAVWSARVLRKDGNIKLSEFSRMLPLSWRALRARRL